MGIHIKPSDLQYRYPRRKETRALPKFSGKPDSHPFDREDLYELIPMFEAVMDELGTADGRALHRLEEILNNEVPRFIATREEVFDCLVGVMRELLGPFQPPETQKALSEEGMSICVDFYRKIGYLQTAFLNSPSGGYPPWPSLPLPSAAAVSSKPTARSTVMTMPVWHFRQLRLPRTQRSAAASF